MYGKFYNANFVLVLDASTANPRTVWCDMADAGQGDDGYEHGFFFQILLTNLTLSGLDVILGFLKWMLHLAFLATQLLF